MIQNLRETKNHGTKEYPFCQYTIANIPHAFHFPIHWHDEMELVLVRQGHLLVNVGGTNFDLTPGQVLIINPRQLHLMVVEDPSVHYNVFLFPLELVCAQTEDLMEQTIFRPLRTGQKMFPNLIASENLSAEELPLLDQILDINIRKPHLYQLETRLLLLRFLLTVLRHNELITTGNNNADELQRQMLEYIRIHYNARISLSDLAAQFHLSPKYLSRYFKEKFHLTLSDYIDHLRMNHAKELLEETDLSITEIAAQCGFSGVSFFIRRFTLSHGCSPLKWRKQQKEVYEA